DAGSSTPTRTTALSEVIGGSNTTPAIPGDGQLRVVVTASTGNGTGQAATTGVVAHRTQLVDCAAPTLTPSTPVDGATYVRGQNVTVDFSCVDAGSGPSVCEGTAGDGDLLDTSVIGDHSFTVNSADGANHQSSVTHEFEVVPATCQGQAGTVY